MAIKQHTPNFWQKRAMPARLLWPLSKLYGLISHRSLQQKALKAQKLPKPTIVIGNINVGGTGKTPATIALTQALQARGIKVAILSRGFGRNHKALTLASTELTALEMGDEPYLIYQKTAAPMAIYHNRYEAGIALLAQNPHIDCFICDDALQHRQLARDIEIALIGKQGFGNGYLLPAGPLREPLERLQTVDYIWANGTDEETIHHLKEMMDTPIIQLKASLQDPRSLHSQALLPFTEWQTIPFTAIAGIAHPENFYQMLEAKGLQFTTRSYPDHYALTEADLADITTPILMTEKDASKCLYFKRENLWRVPLELSLPESLVDEIIEKISTKTS
ncbi:tetraacyldisaccharide 4'-kinase [Ignatzschineria ureiclastica]|uniref:Tetraacyldisaccharide 4'-kinase n=1 Tax=Ignatzschineria ureiclastica TaxID=472582 RepID=A0A2U2AE76_9GAMM|nr:tetraacyldisaccharide 4'-kinase [Ignatzschineria ureiclastica]PWD80965.1 tetraacyldisaccharide 4'-kinase [Ignatzschineria ureiclastica]